LRANQSSRKFTAC